MTGAGAAAPQRTARVRQAFTMADMRSAPASGLQTSRRWLQWWAALAAVAVLAAAGCSGGSVPVRSAAPGPLFPASFKGCTPSGYLGKCRTVWVPQDWAHPHGPQIPLTVAVLPAMAATHPAAPLFILAGWGGPAISSEYVDWAVQAFGQLYQSMDLVFVAQRGTLLSWPQTCPGLGAIGPGLRAAVRRCLASVSRSPRHDTTAAAARDLDQVRKALGYNKINIYGGSYGVSMGLAYLQRYGAHVRTAVFYSGSLLDVPLWQLTPLHAQQAFDQLARRCAATPACGRFYHPAADLATVVNRLRAHPAGSPSPAPAARS
jgi:pimeloyl-ACP methyl ester carboxylesterase